MKKTLLSAVITAASLAVTAAPNEMTVLANKPGAKVQSTMYGIFFEDINFAADGGLYAEMVKNRSFEFPQNFMGWRTFGNVELKDDGPFDKNPHYVRLSYAGHAHKHTGIENEGFFGISTKKGEKYRFSVWARCPEGGKSTILVQVVDNATMGERQEQAVCHVDVEGKEWKKYTAEFEAKKTLNKRLCVSSSVVSTNSLSLPPTLSTSASSLLTHGRVARMACVRISHRRWQT